MADEGRSVVAERFEVCFGKKSAIREHDIERLDRVTLALNVSVAVRIAEGFGRDAEDAVVEDVQNVQARKSAAGVAGAGVEDDFKQFFAQADGS